MIFVKTNFIAFLKCKIVKIFNKISKKGKRKIFNLETQPAKVKSFKKTAIIAALLGAPFPLSHLILILMSKDYFVMWKEAGSKLALVNTMHYLTGDTFRLIIFIALLMIIDTLIFFLMYLLAKRYWIGLLFAPIPVYIAILTIILFLLFAPLFGAITTDYHN